MTNNEFILILVGGVFSVGIGIALFVFVLGRPKPQRKGEEESASKAGDGEPELSLGDGETGETGELHRDQVAKVRLESAGVEREPAKSSRLPKMERLGFWGRLKGVLGEDKRSLKSEWLEVAEESLYTADLGPKTVDHLLQKMSRFKSSSSEELIEQLKSEMAQMVLHRSDPFRCLEGDVASLPKVFLVAGVNGAGKTTTIGKIASQLKQRGLKVMIVAGDTFRAAASEQLKTWAERASADFFEWPETKDPSAVVFKGLEKAKAESFDVVILDTAGRLPNQKPLMDELAKIQRTVERVLGKPCDEKILIVDANQGQNALIQAKCFHEALTLTQVILTKMDGTTKGGTALAISYEIGLPISMVGVGEKVEDLVVFDKENYIEAMFES